MIWMSIEFLYFYSNFCRIYIFLGDFRIQSAHSLLRRESLSDSIVEQNVSLFPRQHITPQTSSSIFQRLWWCDQHEMWRRQGIINGLTRKPFVSETSSGESSRQANGQRIHCIILMHRGLLSSSDSWEEKHMPHRLGFIYTKKTFFPWKVCVTCFDGQYAISAYEMELFIIQKGGAPDAAFFQVQRKLG